MKARTGPVVVLAWQVIFNQRCTGFTKWVPSMFPTSCRWGHTGIWYQNDGTWHCEPQKTEVFGSNDFPFPLGDF